MRQLEAFHFSKMQRERCITKKKVYFSVVIQRSEDPDPGNIPAHEEQRVECSCTDRRHVEIHAEILLIRYTDALPTEQRAHSPGNVTE